MIQTNQYTNGRPIIPTQLSLKDKEVNNLHGLLDSGAGSTSISKRHLLELGIDLNSFEETIQTVD